MPAWVAINAVLGLWNTHMIYRLLGSVRDPAQALMGGFTSSELSRYYLVCIVAFAIGIYAAGALATRLQRTLIMQFALGGLLAAVLCLTVLNHAPLLGLPTWGQPLLFVLFVGSIFVASWFTPVALAYLADSSEHFPSSHGVVMGLYAIFLGLLLLTVLLTAVAMFNVLLMRKQQRRIENSEC